MELNGARILAARKTAGLSRAELSRIAGTSIETIKRAERNENVPSAVALARIAVALGVPMESLFDRDGAAA